MADKRIYELTEASTVGSSDVLALDSQNMAETKKVKVSTITDPLSDKYDIASLSLTGSTNTSGGTIVAGRYFYLDGNLVKAKTDIAAGATFTAGTNYVAAYVGTDLAEVKSDLTNGDITNNYRIKNIDLNIYWTGDVTPSSDTWTTQNATDVAQAIYDLFKNCGGLAGVVYAGKITYNSKKASDGSQLGSSKGWFTLYSSNTYNQMISDNTITRLSFDYRLYGSTVSYKYGLWGKALFRSQKGLSSANVLSDIDERVVHNTITTYKG